MNYFILFNLPKKFKINKELLSQNFYKLQLQFHPDLFINDSLSKKKVILEKSIQINKGYKILKNFLSRAIYLLSLHGFKIKNQKFFSENHGFLEKYFSLYEELDNLKKNNFDETLLNNLLKKISKRIQKYKEEIELEFEKKNFEKVSIVIEKLLFFEKMRMNLKKEQNSFKTDIK
ncbi:MAG: Fe-S protein assembly co-chaperone HscB [Buchnera aphidicola (Brevicoryne brassicae)]|uniref:Co-chaperone protein HscB n=1 Tax=Buchnera aphidicola (Brevicoryne brassicae) TaxID=911343 RepID=A0AAJ5PUV4_9GAMM|nr:Fe-S protein assembly co-chaperone HscB [Buchnera aphidicola]QCI20135.1 Fe-S protein assembly co-chaperone HscB [Buchnera aphidicola (Brevicoryne brassicae)]WAI18957.1 MAG: Fe-S protein assembly co-chaperone HscB [Buchnera aphidicola (Brevicoryne brassicae)]